MSSITIWTQYRLPDGSIISDETDKHQLLEYIEALDALCDTLAIPPISSLVDYSDALESDDDDDFDEEDDYLLDEFNLQRDSDESLWHTPREAIHIIDTLLTSLTEQPSLLEAPRHHFHELLEELQQSLRFIQESIDQQSEQLRFILIN